MLLLRVIVTLGACWIVACDLLDLYVQHMDETMKTMLYRGKRHPMDPAARIKRSPAPEGAEPRLRIGDFKKQRLDVDEDWLRQWIARKRVPYKNDALDSPNGREGNPDPDQHETFATTPGDVSGRAEATATTIAERATEANSRAASSSSTPAVDEDEAEELPIAKHGTTSVEREERTEPERTNRSEQADSWRRMLALLAKVKEYETIESNEINSGLDEPSSAERTTKEGGSQYVEKSAKDARGARSNVRDVSGATTTGWSGRSKRGVTKKASHRLFARYEKLDENGDVVLEWDPTDEEKVTFRVTARTLGYVGVGFNDKSHMKGADILLAWVDDHTGAVNLLVSLLSYPPRFLLRSPIRTDGLGRLIDREGDRRVARR